MIIAYNAFFHMAVPRILCSHEESDKLLGCSFAVPFAGQDMFVNIGLDDTPVAVAAGAHAEYQPDRLSRAAQATGRKLQHRDLGSLAISAGRILQGSSEGMVNGASNVVAPLPPAAAAATAQSGGPEYSATQSKAVGVRALPPECSGPTNNTCQKLWGMNRINAPTLWRKLAGVPTANGWVLRGALLDDGVFMDHYDLRSQFDASDSFTPRGATPAGGRQGTGGSGTHNSGIFVGAWGGGDTRGIVGVAGKARAISCSMIPTNMNGATFAEITSDCIKHVANKNATWVINNGWVFLNPLPPKGTTVSLIRDTIQQFVCDKGGIFVVAAGSGLCRDFPDFNRICSCPNPAAPWSCQPGGISIGVNISDAGILPNGTKVDGRKMYPAAYAEELDCVVAIAATGYEDAARDMKADQIHPTSNWGNAVKLAAPGWDILSDWYNNSAPWDVWASQPSTGMSPSSAHVSGAAYLLRNTFPSASAADIIECLLSTATDPVLPPSNVFFNDPAAVVGGGILDVDEAYTCVHQKLGVTGVACVDRTYSMQYGSCDSVIIPPTDMYTDSTGGTAASVVVSHTGPYLPGVTVVTVTPTNGSAGCTSTVTVVPCKVKCNSARAIAPTPPWGSTTCRLRSVDLPDMVDERSLGSTMTRLTRNPPGPYRLGSTAISFVAVYPGGVRSPSATCPLTVSGPPVVPMTVKPKNTCIWRRSPATREYCFKPADLVAVTGGANACTGGSPPVVQSMGCGANGRCTAVAPRASSGIGSGRFEGASAATAGQPAAAASSDEDFVAPATFWNGFGAYKGYAWLGRWYMCPITAAFRYQAVGDNCRVYTSGLLCVQFDNEVPLQVVMAQATVSDSSSTQTVTSRISMWNQASATRPAGLPASCIAA